ncbi:MAG: hypothetical protein Q9M89_06555 [Persephonella sp.]|nr:hypothetical protein [Persephonella sp.]
MARKSFPRVWEFPFDSNLRLMATVNQVEGSKYIFIKGAFESLKEMSKENSSQLENWHNKMAEKGLRVLAFGYSKIDSIPDNIKDIKINIVGLIGFIDPPKAGVKDAVITAKKAGIRVIMVTGDNLKNSHCYCQGSIHIRKKCTSLLKGTDLMSTLMKNFTIF